MRRSPRPSKPKGPLTEAEREYVRSHFPQLGVTAIARNLGRGRSAINKVVKDEGLRERDVREPSSPEAGGVRDDAPEDALGRLKELRDMLRKQLEVAGPKETAALAREYRATVESIERMEGDPTDDAAIALDAVASSIARRMPS